MYLTHRTSWSGVGSWPCNRATEGSNPRGTRLYFVILLKNVDFFFNVSNSTTYETCLAYSNSVCKLIMLRLHKPALVIILMYHPPTCSPKDFNDIISRSQAIIISMSSPLPNIIMLGDFNFPYINWLNPEYNCHDASPLILFLNQQVSAPTRKSNILDLIFSPDDFINCIDITDSIISDHRIITEKTLIPISQSSPPLSNYEFCMQYL